MKQKRNHILLSAMGLYLGAFAIPAGIMAWILYQRGFSPFGDKTLFVMDMKDQYLEFFAYLRHVTGGDNSVFYCWSRSLGRQFSGAFCLLSGESLFLDCLSLSPGGTEYGDSAFDAFKNWSVRNMLCSICGLSVEEERCA